MAFPQHIGTLANLASIRRPLLLVQGRNDPTYRPTRSTSSLRRGCEPAARRCSTLGADDEGGRYLRNYRPACYYAAAADFLRSGTR